ncbi:unnamed protein product [Linum tenue]|uniref:Uncharacterized protein n=1 Tax=Linum tenue TaxID=586396 RepID=A0AAV0JEK0_9ROSI|nr:unnamed protein product [Linum tenue]
MHHRITTPPKLLSQTAGHSSCCIFRAPTTFAGVNNKSYQPHIVSIGPYHRGKPHLAMIQEHKWRYLGSLLARIPNLTLESLLSSIAPLESQIRASYSEQIDLDRDEFLELMVLDGCFVVELFRKVAGVVEFEPHDPIVAMSWIMPFFYRDFLRLENQIPFSVLESLFNSTHGGEEKETITHTNSAFSSTELQLAYKRKHSNHQNPHNSRKKYETRIDISLGSNSSNRALSLSALALYFFNHSMQRPEEIVYKYRDLKGKHLLDLIRSSYTQFDPPPVRRSSDSPPTHIIHSITKLRKAGIKLRRVDGGEHDGSPLQVRFRRGVVEMPSITIDDFMSSFLVNAVAYEQCYGGGGGGGEWPMHFTAYATLLDSLVNGFRDVEYLVDKDILENYLGTEAEVARFLNDLGKEVAFDIDECYLAEVFGDVHRYYGSSWHFQWASFKFTYFQTPWSFISALAALVLLVLTVLQTVYTIYGTYS